MARGLVVFILLGLVSLFADMAYEGARSVVGPFMGTLGAGLLIVGSVSVGEVLTHVGRLLGGLLAHRVRSSGFYWGLLFLGYLLNLGAVPLLAFAGRWQEAFLLVILERLGKGLRTPVRDALLAETGRGLGSGRLYAIHEFLDQLGAVGGPLLMAWTLSRPGGDYFEAFLILAIPAALAMVLLASAFILHPVVEEARRTPEGRGLPRGFIVYAVASGLSIAGLMHWAQASYRAMGVGVEAVALAYSIAMLSDALAALALGWGYDRFSRKVILVTPTLTLAATALFYTGALPLTLAAVVWGVALGGYESVYRSLAADFLPHGSRALGFGVFYFSLGLGWTLGNIAMAILAPGVGLVLVFVLELASTALLQRVIR